MSKFEFDGGSRVRAQACDKKGNLIDDFDNYYMETSFMSELHHHQRQHLPYQFENQSVKKFKLEL